MRQNAEENLRTMGFAALITVAVATAFATQEVNAQDQEETPENQVMEVTGEFNFAWAPDSDGTITANSRIESIVDEQYQAGHLRITDFSGGIASFSIEEVKGSDIKVSKMKDPAQDFLDDNKFFGYGGIGSDEEKLGSDLIYGTWYRKRFNCPQDLCYSLIFVPNAESIVMLNTGESVTSTYTHFVHRVEQPMEQQEQQNLIEVDKHSIEVTISRSSNEAISLVSVQENRYEANEGDEFEIALVVDPPAGKPFKVNYTIIDSETQDSKQTAEPADYLAPQRVSEQIEVNDTEGKIKIRLAEDEIHEDIEKFQVVLESGVGYRLIKGNYTTTVEILDNDAPDIIQPEDSCVYDSSNKPVVTSDPWVKASFNNPPSPTGEEPTRIYWIARKPNGNFYSYDINVKFVHGSFDPVLVDQERELGTKRIMYTRAYDLNNRRIGNQDRFLNANLRNEKATGHRYNVSAPPGYRGYVRYRLHPRTGDGAKNDTWYEVAAPCEFHVWWVDSHRPGIELNVDRTRVQAGGSTLVTVSATPVPIRDINVRIEVSNVNRFDTSGGITAQIKAGQKSATVKLDTFDLGSGKETVKISAGWNSNYFVDPDLGSKEITFVDHGMNLVNFTKEKLNVDVFENETATVPIRLKNPAEGLVSVNYQIVEEGGATAGEDFLVSGLPSVGPSAESTEETPTEPAVYYLDVPDGMQDASIEIPIVLNQDEDDFTERFKIVLVDSDTAKADYNNEAFVSIITTVRPVVSYPSESCDAGIPKPENAPDPHTVAFFTSSRPGSVYQTPNSWHNSPHFRFELSDSGQRTDLRGTGRWLYIGEFSPDGGTDDYYSDLGANASVGRFGFLIPSDKGRGPFIYRMLPRSADNPTFTTVRQPCEYHIWVTDADKPGISLSFKQSIVGANTDIKLIATAHPAPARTITVPFTLSDPSLVQDPDPLEVTIEAGSEFGEVQFTTSELPQGSATADLVARVEYRSNFWLDESVDEARLRISQDPNFSVEFADDSISPIVNESKGDVKLEVRLSQRPFSSVTVNYTVGDGDSKNMNANAMSGTDFIIPDNTQVTIPAGQTIGIISIPILQEAGHDGNPEAIERFTVTLTGTEEGAEIGTNAVSTVTILDTRKPIILISAQTDEIMAGNDAVFIVQAFPPPSEDILIPFRITQQEQVVDFILPSEVRIRKGLRTANIIIPTVNGNTRPNLDGRVTLTILKIDGHDLVAPDLMVSEQNSIEAAVTVKHNENPGTKYSVAFEVIKSIILGQQSQTSPQSTAPALKPLLRIQSENPTVTEGEIIEFKISVAGGNSSPENLAASVKVTEEGDFIGGGFSRTVVLARGKSEAGFSVSTIDDNLAEYDSSVTATLLNGPEYELDSQFSATVLVTDNADRETRNSRIVTANRDVLPDLMAALSERSLNTTSLRVSQTFSRNVETNIQLGGQSSLEGLLTAGGEAMNEERFDWKPVLGNSSLVLNLSPEDNGSNFGTIWAFGDYRTVSKNDSRLDQSWSGELLTGHMGFDTRVGEDSLFGFSAFVSETEADYDLLGDVELAYAVQTNGIQPYLAYSSPNDNVLVQVSAGYGTGEIAIDEDEYDTLILDSTFHMMTLRGSHRLFHSESTLASTKSLNIIGEGWMAGQFAQSNEEYIGDLYSKVRHLRLVAEGTGSRNLPGGASLKQEASVGMLHNSKDNQSTIDLELTGSLDYLDPVGVDVSLSGRTLVDKFEETREWILRTTLNADFGKDRTGVLLKVSPSLAWLRGSSDTSLWNKSLVADRFDTRVNQDGFAVNSEIGYGFAAFDDSGIITPYGGFNMAQNQRKSIHLGNRIAVNPHFNLGLESTYTIPEKDFYGYGTELNGRFQW